MNCEETMDDALNEIALQERLARIGRIFIVLSGKGGVGKSTVAVNLALSLSLRGMRTGILDVDIHGPSVPKLLGVSGKRITVTNDEIIPLEVYGNMKAVSMAMFLVENDLPVIWRGPMKAKVIREFVQNVAWGDLDCLVVDCPPGTGDEPLSVAQLFKGKSTAVIVTTPQQMATIDVEKCITFCRQLDLPIAGVIENMSGFVCPDCGKTVDIFSSGGGEKLAERFGIPFLGKIPLDPDIVKSGDDEQPYVYHYSKTKTAEMFDEIVDWIVGFGKDVKADACCGITAATSSPEKDIAAPVIDEKEEG
jgi:ATP-binding protein involved in chromosome partitioning